MNGLPGTPLAVIMAYRAEGPRPCGLALLAGPLRGGLGTHHLPWHSRCSTTDETTERAHAGGDVCLSADASPHNCLFTEAVTWAAARAEMQRLIAGRRVLLPEPLMPPPYPEAAETYPPDGPYAVVPHLSPAEALALIDAAIDAAEGGPQ